MIKIDPVAYFCESCGDALINLGFNNSRNVHRFLCPAWKKGCSKSAKIIYINMDTGEVIDVRD